MSRLKSRTATYKGFSYHTHNVEGHDTYSVRVSATLDHEPRRYVHIDIPVERMRYLHERLGEYLTWMDHKEQEKKVSV